MSLELFVTDLLQSLANVNGKMVYKKASYRKFVVVITIFQVAVAILFTIFVRYDRSIDPKFHTANETVADNFMNDYSRKLTWRAKRALIMSTLINAHSYQRARLSTRTHIKCYAFKSARLLPNKIFLSFSVILDIQVMLFVGFGFLMTFLRRFGYSAVCFTMLLIVFCVEYAILVKGFT